MKLSEWLDDAIAEQAAEQGVDPQDFDREDRLEAIAERLASLERRGGSDERRRRNEEDDEERPPRPPPSREEAKRAEDLLEESIGKLESRTAETEKRTARALDSVVDWIERSDGGARVERRAIESIAERLEAIERRIVQQDERREAASRAAEAQRLSAISTEDGARELDERMNQLARRIEAAEKDRLDAQRSRPRVDFAQAVSEIARRRQALDRTRGAPPTPRPPQSAGANHIDVEAPGAAPTAEAKPASLHEEASVNLHADLQRLGLRLEEIVRDQAAGREAPQADVAAMRSELSAMSRALADLAPRNAVAGIEGAVRDLSQRVASLQDRDLRESLTKPVDEIVSAIRETLRAHDPREAVANLDRDIHAIAAKVDALANSQVDPEAFDRIRRQTEDVRNMLAAAATRPMPVDRLEKQIGELADRIDRLTVSRSPNVDSARVLASLAQTHEQIERSTPAAALNLIERRLEAVSAKMDQALARAQAVTAITPKAVEELARRIESVRETIETRHPLPIVSASLEATMRDLSARLQDIEAARHDPEALAAWMREVSAKLQDIEAARHDPEPLAAWMREVSAKLQDIEAARHNPEAPAAWMREVSAKLQDIEAARHDPGALEAWMGEVSARLQDMQAERLDPRSLEAWMREVSARLRETQAARQDPRSLEAWMREVSATLQETQAAHADPEALRAWMREVSAKLQETQAPRADPEPLAGWMREISAKLETARPVSLDTEPLERWMRELTEKLERAPPPIDSVALESLIRSLEEKLDRPATPPMESVALESLIRSLEEKLDRPATPPMESVALESLIRGLEEKLDRPAMPPIDSGALESLMRGLEEKLERPPSPIDSGALESMIRGLEEKLEQARVGETDQSRLATLQSQVARIDERLARADADFSSLSAVGRMVAQLSTQLEETREALRIIPTLEEGAGNGGVAERRIDTLRTAQEASERRVQSTLTGVHGMLEKLVDRMARLEDDVVRSDEPSVGEPLALAQRSANGGTGQALGVELPKRDIAPAQPVADRPQVRTTGAPSPQLGERSDFLIEPGAGAPPKTAINAHIAAARRAAQAAMAENSATKSSEEVAAGQDGPRVPGALAQAKEFLNARRRPILLGLAFLILGTIAVIELGARFHSSNQKSEVVAPPGKTSSEPALAPPKNDARALDMSPTGAIASPQAGAPTDLRRKSPVPAPLDLVSLIPSTTPQALRDGAAAGDPGAEFELASRLAEGRNMARDYHAASQWFERAALQNFAPAEYRLGGLYEKGNGVEHDPALAKAWYQKAAEIGNVRAMHNLAVLAAESSGAKPDYAEAFNWFQKAAQFGVRDSQFNLAILYARGLGVSQDLNQSWLWFSLAAQQGDTDAAKKRDEVALKLDANSLAANAAALAAFHPLQPDPAANELKAPEGGWDAVKAPGQSSEAPHKPSRVTPL
jgi:localization factor PodJL